jgi:Kef-type K+ transport system membrane component KefB
LSDRPALISLLLITLLAALVPPLSSKFKRFVIPTVIGEILAGMLIGKSGLGLVKPGPILQFLSDFGFVFLMFISGLEVDFRGFSFSDSLGERRTLWRNPFSLAVLSFLVTLICAFAIARAFLSLGLVKQSFIMGLILSTTSMGIVVPVLKERGDTATPYGQLMVLTALLADFVTLILLSFSFVLLEKGLGLQMTFLLALLAIFVAVLHTGILAKRVPALRRMVRELTTATAQIRVRGTIAFMIGWVALAEVLGTEFILGAFLAGVIVKIIAGREEEALTEKLEALGFGFFIPVFFISVGSNFDLGALLESRQALVLLPLLLAAAYAVKLIPSLIYRMVYSWRESMAAGFLLSSRLSLIIAASALALKLGVIGEALNSTIILVAVFTSILSPALFSHIAPAPVKTPRGGFVVVGLNQLTSLLVERLLREGEEVAVLQCPTDRPDQPYCKGTLSITGDPHDEKILEEIGAGRAAALVSALEKAEDNLRVCRLAKERFGIPVLVSRADDREMMERMKALGIRVIQPALATVIALEGALRFPAAFDILAEQVENIEIGEATVGSKRFRGKPLRNLLLPGNALVMGIRREGDIIIPHGDTSLQLGDVVMLVGSPDAVRETRRMLGGDGK